MKRDFSGGVVTARDRSDLRESELVSAIGGHYKPGDPRRIHKLGGRSTFGDTTTAKKINGLALCQFDSGTDRLIALTNGALYRATPGETGSFGLEIGTAITGTTLDSAHADDLWYLTVGDQNKVLKPSGVFRTMGMQPPAEAPVLTTIEPGSDTAVSANANTGNLDNPDNAHDDDLETFASATLTTESSTISETYSFASGTPFAVPHFKVVFGLRGERAGQVALVTIEVSTDGGSNYVEKWAMTWRGGPTLFGPRTARIDASGLSDNDQAKIRVTLTINVGAGTPVTLQINEAALQSDDLDLAAVATGGILKYAIVEYDSARPDHLSSGKRSPTAEVTVEATTHNGVQLDFTGVTKRNASATHWGLYRSAYGGTDTQLFLLGYVPITDDYYDDYFDAKNDPASQLDEPYPMLSITGPGGEGTTYYHQNVAPPLLRRIAAFEGALVGLGNANKRALYYSVPGLYESWPSIYAYDKFPLPEHDQLVDISPLGSSLVIGCKATMVRLDGLPQVVSGSFVGRAFQIKGAPGCVGDYAMTAISLRGEQAVGWIAPDGLYVTNGHTFSRISNDIDWSDFENKDMSGWVLRWDQQHRSLIFCYSTIDGNENDRYWTINMEDVHRVKDSGQPKWTGAHYGDIACWVAGYVANVFRRYSGHISDGKVYLEHNEDTGADSSNAYDGSGTHILEVETGHVYNEWDEWAVGDARLGHTDFGAGQSATVAWLHGREASGEEETKSQSVSLVGQKKTQFDVARSGDYHQVKVTHLGTGLGALQDLLIDAHPMGRSGQVGS